MANRIRFTTAFQVVEAFPEAADDLGEVPEDIAPLDHMAELGKDLNPNPALIFAGLALPKRESVWWACLVLRGLGLLDGETGSGLALAEAWAMRPEEDERRACGTFAEEVYFEGPGAWVAFAAFSTSGSLAPAGLQSVPPSPEVSGKSAAMAVMLAIADEDAFSRLAKARAALACAQEFALGGDGKQAWKDYAEGKFKVEPELID
ncbi:MAG: hypothetical protein AAF439_14075 [Pseudomonadota bacterium]